MIPIDRFINDVALNITSFEVSEYSAMGTHRSKSVSRQFLSIVSLRFRV